jgi:hypothetical protein
VLSADRLVTAIEFYQRKGIVHMTFVHPLQQSRDWYKFVSGTAVKDPEVLKLVSVYIDAMKKLNRRLLELAGSDPTLKALADAHAFDAAIQMAREYNEFHGVKMTDAELRLDAQKHGLDAAAGRP